jgi:hypothetical protein
MNHDNNINKKFPGKNLNIFIGSWNIGGVDLPKDFSLIPWLCPKLNQKIPDMYFLGFQEIINLSSTNILIASNNSSKIESLRLIAFENLKTLGKFTMVKILDLVGILFMIFIKEDLCEYIKNIETSIVKLGLLGTLGNKGYCIIRFNIQDVSFAFSCCHLKSGKKEVNGRKQEVIDILNYNIPLRNSKEMLFKDHDIFFIFGDLNFRIDSDLKTCVNFIKTGYLETLYLYDQLNKKKNLCKDLMVLDEMKINFPPTYKYEIGTNEYDFKQKRIPSWCDRITFNFNPSIKGMYYDSIENFKESDHKPIYGIFKILINENLNNTNANNFIDDNSNKNDIHNNMNNLNKDFNSKLNFNSYNLINPNLDPNSNSNFIIFNLFIFYILSFIFYNLFIDYLIYYSILLLNI